MKKLCAALLFAALLGSLVPDDVLARGGRSSGRSYSSGRSSSSRSSSSGRSYSSGRSSSSRPSSSGRSYSSGRSSTPSTSRPSYTSPRTSTPSGKGYGSGTSPRYTTPSSKGFTPRTTSRPPTTPGRLHGGAFDASAAAAQKRVESRKTFTAGKTPKTTYQPPAGGTARSIDAESPRVRQLRRELNEERWVNRELRMRHYFTPYYGPAYPAVYYHDPFSSVFWYWLLAQNLNTRATWAYHHRYDMDEARYRALLEKDAQLETRLRELEAQKVPRDSAYVPKELAKDPDVMYTDEYVNAIFNPQPNKAGAPQAPPPTEPPVVYVPSVPPRRAPGMSAGQFFWAGVRFFIAALLLLAALAFLIWVVFIKRWGGS